MTQIKKPLLMIACILICLFMVRLGFWQLDRAEQKNQIHQNKLQHLDQSPVNLTELIKQGAELQRFQAVKVLGNYIPEKTIFIDNQVLNGKVGYHVVSPFQIDGDDQVVLVNRGWLPVGMSRDNLPEIVTPSKQLNIHGRFNKSHAKPPIWSDEYPAFTGKVWQFLEMGLYAEKMRLKPLPLMLELAPEIKAAGGYERAFEIIGDGGVGKHKAYALQWFGMAVALFIAGLTVLMLSFRETK